MNFKNLIKLKIEEKKKINDKTNDLNGLRTVYWNS